MWIPTVWWCGALYGLTLWCHLYGGGTLYRVESHRIVCVCRGEGLGLCLTPNCMYSLYDWSVQRGSMYEPNCMVFTVSLVCQEGVLVWSPTVWYSLYDWSVKSGSLYGAPPVNRQTPVKALPSQSFGCLLAGNIFMLARPKDRVNRVHKNDIVYVHIVTFDSFQCDLCGHVSACEGGHRAHLVFHGGHKKYTCQCGLKFK